MHILCRVSMRPSPPKDMVVCSFARPPSFLEICTMKSNPILDELHETRERLLAEAGGTLDALVAQLQHDERLSGREFVRPGCQSRRCTTETGPEVLTSNDRLAAR